MRHEETTLRPSGLRERVTHPLRSARRWRWRRDDRRRDESLAGYHTPAQVCPRGCGYRELARREWLARTSLLGTALVQITFIFETTNCPECGALLARECPRCHADVVAPVRDRCESCGLPQPWARERQAGLGRTRVRYWRPGEDGAHPPAILAYEAEGGAIWVIEEEVARLAVDAIVSNDTVDGQMWAQVARSIKTAAGEGIERLAQEESPRALGEAWSTEAGGLEAHQIIHVASMNRTGRTTPASVRDSLLAALRLARAEAETIAADATETEDAGFSVAVATIGMATIPSGEWFEIFADVALDVLHEPPAVGRLELAIVLALFEPPRPGAELHGLEEALRRSWQAIGEPKATLHPLAPERLG